MRKILRRVLIGGVVLLLLIQAVPYGRDHSNPPVGAEPPWPSARVKELARRACFDCHSHEVVWPWYSHVAPMSWLVQKDVDEGREQMNLSTWDRTKHGADDAAEELEEGEMPPAIYLPLHPDARLSAAEKAELVAGFRAMAGGGHGGDKEHD